MVTRVKGLLRSIRSVGRRFGKTVLRHRAERVLVGSAEEIWRQWMDPCSWAPGLVAFGDAGAGPRGPGSVLVSKAKGPFGMVLTGHEEIVEYDPPRRLRVKSRQLGLDMRHGFSTEPTGDGRTRCIYESEVVLEGPIRLAAGLVNQMEQGGLDGRLKLFQAHVAKNA